MTEYIKNTGEMPVPKGTPVDVIFRNGAVTYNVPAGVSAIENGPLYLAYDWSITESRYDIMQWRPASEED